jgi:hypothetical protein
MDTSPAAVSIASAARTWPAVAFEAVPVAAVVAIAAALSWAGGSILAGDWLGWETLAGLVLAVVLAAGACAVPSRAAVTGIAGLTALAAWDALSLRWSAVPALARDEALLVVFFVVAALVPLVSLKTEAARTLALATVVGAAAALGLATAARLVLSAHPEDLYDSGRLSAPIGYANAQAAAFALVFWPGIALASTRRLPTAARAVVFASATVCLAGWVATQSKGAGIGLAAGGVVFFALTRDRLRALLPTLVAAAIAAGAYRPVTAPFRAPDAALAAAARHAGGALLVVAAAAVAAGLAYAAADRAIAVPERIRRRLAIVVVGLLAALAVFGAAAAAVHVRHPEAFVQKRWNTFKRPPVAETGSSHFQTLGSDRYDMWRVALDAVRAHPLAGVGARGYGVLYLRKASIQRSPQRAHSLELDVLSETGVVGFVLLAAGLGGLLVAVAQRARAWAPGAAVLAAATGWIVHASVDWLWTLPACALPFFVVLGVGAPGASRPRLQRRVALSLGAAVVAVVLAACVPPWLAARDVAQAYAGSPAWEQELDRARTLDPLSTDPLVARATLAPRLPEAVDALRQAIRMEPQSVEAWYLLGVRYLRAGKRKDAIAALERARTLAPRDTFVRNALWEARRR